MTGNITDHVASGFVCGSPVDEHCAQSASSANRTRQKSFALNLVTSFVATYWRKLQLSGYIEN